MVLLGVVLVLLAAGAGVLLFVGTARLTDTVDISILGGTLSLPPLTLLITGMVVITLFWLGWALMRAGLRRGKRRRLQAKDAVATAEARRVEDGRRMQDEFDARERALVEERRRDESQATPRHGAEPGDTTPPAGSTVDDRVGGSRTTASRTDPEAAGTRVEGSPPDDTGDTRRG